MNCPDTDLTETVYDALHNRVDTFTQDDLLKQIEKIAVVEFNEDTKKTAVPKIEMLSLHGQSGGQEGGAQKKIIPQTFVRCEELSCQFSMELENEVSA